MRSVVASTVRKVCVALAAACCAVGLVGCASPVTFTNPIKDIANDPYVVLYDHHYYLIESWDGGFWITKSATDNLTDIAWAGDREKVWSYSNQGANCTEYWAPELHQVDDRWYIYYSASTCDADTDWNHRMFVLESVTSDPMGDYVDRGEVSDGTDLWAIDGTRFEWQGKAYFVWSGRPNHVDRSQNLYIAEMDGPTQLAGPGVEIAAPEYKWEDSEWPTAEGPEAIVTDKSVFLVYSANYSGGDHYAYGMLTATASDLLDPNAWTKSATPVFQGTDKVISPGHGSFVLSPDGRQWWMIYHAARYPGSGWDRVMMTQQFTWSNGRPDFGKPVPAGTPLPVPSGQQPATLATG